MTEELKKAFEHIKKSHPSASMVVFDRDGRWQYMDENFNGFVFGDEIDVSILEEASDSIPVLPYVYQL